MLVSPSNKAAASSTWSTVLEDQLETTCWSTVDFIVIKGCFLASELAASTSVQNTLSITPKEKLLPLTSRTPNSGFLIDPRQKSSPKQQSNL